MRQAVLELRESEILAGLESDLGPQFGVPVKQLFPQRSGFLDASQLQVLGTSIHMAIRKCIDKLLLNATQTHVVIVEPPLFALPLKRLVTAAVLGELRCLSLAFTSYAACWCVSQGIREAIIDTRFMGVRYIVPVYDLRELSHLIKSDSEDQDALGWLESSLPIDLRHLPVMQATSSAWLGAAISCSNVNLESKVTRGQFLKEGTIQDSLLGNSSSS